LLFSLFFVTIIEEEKHREKHQSRKAEGKTREWRRLHQLIQGRQRRSQGRLNNVSRLESQQDEKNNLLNSIINRRQIVRKRKKYIDRSNKTFSL